MSYKTFQNGFPLPASDLNNYLMNQVVATFANSTARSSAIASPQEGQVTYLEDTEAYEKWDGSAWVDFFPASTAVSSGNSIINGGFDIWQRGTSFTPTAAAWTYTADRWDSGRATSTSGATVTRQAASLQNQTYSLRYQRDSGNTSTSALYLVQRLESAMSIPLQGETLVLSFYAKAGANYSAASSALNLHVYSGTGTDQGGFPSTWTGTFTIVNNQAFTLNTSWTRYEVSFNMPSLATQLGMLWTFNPTGTAGANDYYEIAGVQLEVGSTATDFRRNANSLQGELAACARYYERISLGRVNTATSGTSTVMSLPYMTRKRSTPSVSTNATNANYTTVWQFSQSGVSLSSKSGTATINFDGSDGSLNHMQINIFGATYSPIPNTLESISGLYFEANSEL